MKIMRASIILVVSFTVFVVFSVGCTKDDAKGSTSTLFDDTETTSEKVATETLSIDEELLGISESVVGDKVYFGSCEQDYDFKNGKEPIIWRVLAKEKLKVLLVSEKILDCKRYNDSAKGATWETCSLRAWLNDDFYISSFSSEEKNWISTTLLLNKDNPYHSTWGGNDTNDNVFALSFWEAESYFKQEDRVAVGTQYAKSNNLSVFEGSASPFVGNSAWWLRSPGHDSMHAGSVSSSGDINNYNYYANDSNLGVRPCIWINIKI